MRSEVEALLSIAFDPQLYRTRGYLMGTRYLCLGDAFFQGGTDDGKTLQGLRSLSL